MTPDLIIDAIVAIARFLRLIKAERIVGKVRRRAARGYFELLHLDVVHRMRKLGIHMEDGKPDQLRASELAIEFCSACALLMGRIIEVEHNEIHCCLKVIVRGPEGDLLQTWARSEPADERDENEGGTPLVRNTIWNAFSGGDDGKNHWRRMNCFCCNDLTQHVSEFDNGRAVWDKFYRSKLTFPLRYIDKGKPKVCETMGFLEFDSTKKNAFVGMPCAFDHVKTPDVYKTLLEQNAIFHAGAIIADTVSMCLRSYYESRKRNQERR